MTVVRNGKRYEMYSYLHYITLVREEHTITRNNARGCHDDECCVVLRLRESVDGEEEQKREYSREEEE